MHHAAKAVEDYSIDVFITFLTHGADYTIKNNEGKTCLELIGAESLRAHNPQILTAIKSNASLLEAYQKAYQEIVGTTEGLAYEAPIGRYTASSFVEAAEWGQLNEVKRILSFKPNVNMLCDVSTLSPPPRPINPQIPTHRPTTQPHHFYTPTLTSYMYQFIASYMLLFLPASRLHSIYFCKLSWSHQHCPDLVRVSRN